MTRIEKTIQGGVLIAVVALLMVFVECQSPVRADVAVIASDHWTAGARLWTARAAVAEVGWSGGPGMTEAKRRAKRAEQLAVLWVLRARFVQLRRRWPAMRFVDVVRAYCSGLGLNRAPSPRQRWIRGLNLTASRPPGWPSNLNWDHYAPLWTETLEVAEAWAQNRTGRNPCPGASHFGGLRAGDLPRGRMVRHDCSDRFERFRGSTFFVVNHETRKRYTRKN